MRREYISPLHIWPTQETDTRLDGKEQDIRALLGKDVSKASIAKILDVSRSALYHFIETRKIAPG